jgi:hypothetical protein
MYESPAELHPVLQFAPNQRRYHVVHIILCAGADPNARRWRLFLIATVMGAACKPVPLYRGYHSL